MTVDSPPDAFNPERRFLDENGFFVQSNEEFFFEQLLMQFSPRITSQDGIGSVG